uniref:AB hydrolase-1 domain-containing protein n=1 Tax=Aegilops tauschii subsp. strangulata TaxID=200361 RepID=A0A453DFS1_AEGTS
LGSSELDRAGMEGGEKQQHHHHHFVLIHGVCHGAWSWYRVATALEAAGHRVTAPDMAGCGASPGRGEEVASFEEYSRPLLDAVAALPEAEQAVLVAHSFGGQSLALAMERHPEKVSVAVFVTATMPAAGKPMTYAFKQLSQGKGPDFFMDCALGSAGDPRNPDKTFLFGPKYMARRVYQLSPPEVCLLYSGR